MRIFRWLVNTVKDRMTTSWSFRGFLGGIGVEFRIRVGPTVGGWETTVNLFIGREPNRWTNAPLPPGARDAENPKLLTVSGTGLGSGTTHRDAGTTHRAPGLADTGWLPSSEARE